MAKGSKFWTKAEVPGLELSPGTMVYAEVVLEYKGEFKSQIKKQAFHIIDAISLGDEDVKNLHYTERSVQFSLLNGYFTYNCISFSGKAYGLLGIFMEETYSLAVFILYCRIHKPTYK